MGRKPSGASPGCTAKLPTSRKDFLHKSSKDISKNHAVVFVEDLQVKNLRASSKGRKAKPGKRVAQKSGLNRAMERRAARVRATTEHQPYVSLVPAHRSREPPDASADCLC